MQPRHADVVQPQHLVAENLRRQRRLLRDRDVAGAAGHDGDSPDAVRLRERSDDADAGRFVILQRNLPADLLRRFLAQARDEDGFLPVRLHGSQDAQHLRGRFPCAVDHLGGSLSEFPVQVDLGKADVLKGLGPDFQQRLLHGKRAVLYRRKHLLQFAHFRTSRSRQTDE